MKKLLLAASLLLALFAPSHVLATPTNPPMRFSGVQYGQNDKSVWVTAYGAIGDGNHDDTSAIQNAINDVVSAGGGIVHLPTGTFKLSSTLTITDAQNLSIEGAGIRVTTFQWAGAASSVMIDIRGLRYASIGGFSMVGDAGGLGGTQTAIKYNGDLSGSWYSSRNTFHDIFIESGFAYGIRIGQVALQCDQTEYRHVLIYHCSTAGVSIEDANAVFHNFYDSTWQYNAIGITSDLAGDGGSFNLYGCGFAANTGDDIQTYPGSRGYIVSGTWSEGDAVFLRMPGASTNSTVSLIECSVNGSKVAGPHIIASSGNLNIVGGRYTGHYPGFGPFDFMIDVSVGTQGKSANINIQGATFPDGNPLTGPRISLGSITQMGAHYAAIGGDTPNIIGPSVSATDTAGTNYTITAGEAGPVSSSAGQLPGDLILQGGPGVSGDATHAAGKGGNVWIVGRSAGVNNGGGGQNGGYIYLQPGAGTGAGVTGVIEALDAGGVARWAWNPAGTTSLYPLDDKTRKIGGPTNRLLGIFSQLSTTTVGSNIASATTIAPTNGITHITGTTTIQTITAPADFASSGNGGCMRLIFDGVAPWNAAGNIAVAGTPTTAGTFVDFCYDNGTSKFYPSRTL